MDHFVPHSFLKSTSCRLILVENSLNSHSVDLDSHKK